ncbi:hard surface induced 3 [Fusarium beomiforme]|uniref:Hard surface induced 3 n=1 Tax=Fusarium beomiforme TaxID=44412 RepID=A0A9P5AEQ4_9HYPO|nr:hard surface induced 3 [Fusarium beomiforme]
MSPKQEGYLEWIEGLRGIASTLVWITHVSRAFDYDLYYPVSGEGLRPRLLQLPFLRVLIQGRLGPITFIYLTGYVCALKPLGYFRRNDYEAGWSCISKSALRRLPRLLYPSTIATMIAWTATQLGLFQMARQSDSYYLTETVQEKLPILPAIRNLFVNIVNTWGVGGNKYDVHQSILFAFFKGSIFVYLFISATAKVQSQFRMGAALVLWSYYWYCAEPYFMQFWWGVFMNDLHNSQLFLRVSRSKSRFIPCLGFFFVFTGLFIASYPESGIERATWSRWQDWILSGILPKDSEFPQFASAFGFNLLTIGGALIPEYRTLLSHPILLWLGRYSFAVYLLHGTLLRWLLCWMVYGPGLPSNVQIEEPGELLAKATYPGNPRLLVCLPFWLTVLYGSAALWTRYVDTRAERFTTQLIAYIQQQGFRDLSLV